MSTQPEPVPPYPGAPRWVKVSVAVAIVLGAAIVVLELGGVIGRHGPGRHLDPAGGAHDHPPIVGDAGAHAPHQGRHR